MSSATSHPETVAAALELARNSPPDFARFMNCDAATPELATGCLRELASRVSTAADRGFMQWLRDAVSDQHAAVAGFVDAMLVVLTAFPANVRDTTAWRPSAATVSESMNLLTLAALGAASARQVAMRLCSNDEERPWLLDAARTAPGPASAQLRAKLKPRMTETEFTAALRREHAAVSESWAREQRERGSMPSVTSAQRLNIASCMSQEVDSAHAAALAALRDAKRRVRTTCADRDLKVCIAAVESAANCIALAQKEAAAQRGGPADETRRYMLATMKRAVDVLLRILRMQSLPRSAVVASRCVSVAKEVLEGLRRIMSQAHIVATFGLTSTGKSTLAMALTGWHTLPASAEACTAVPTLILHDPAAAEPQLYLGMHADLVAVAMHLRTQLAGLRTSYRGAVARVERAYPILQQIAASGEASAAGLAAMFPTTTVGEDAVRRVLEHVNDLMRLLHNMSRPMGEHDVLSLSMPPEHVQAWLGQLPWESLPVIRVAFRSLRGRQPTGQVGILDTPGQMESGGVGARLTGEAIERIVSRVVFTTDPYTCSSEATRELARHVVRMIRNTDSRAEGATAPAASGSRGAGAAAQPHGGDEDSRPALGESIIVAINKADEWEMYGRAFPATSRQDPDPVAEGRVRAELSRVAGMWRALGLQVTSDNVMPVSALTAVRKHLIEDLSEPQLLALADKISRRAELGVRESILDGLCCKEVDDGWDEDVEGTLARLRRPATRSKFARSQLEPLIESLSTAVDDWLAAACRRAWESMSLSLGQLRDTARVVADGYGEDARRFMERVVPDILAAVHDELRAALDGPVRRHIVATTDVMMQLRRDAEVKIVEVVKAAPAADGWWSGAEKQEFCDQDDALRAARSAAVKLVGIVENRVNDHTSQTCRATTDAAKSGMGTMRKEFTGAVERGMASQRPSDGTPPELAHFETQLRQALKADLSQHLTVRSASLPRVPELTHLSSVVASETKRSGGFMGMCQRSTTSFYFSRAALAEQIVKAASGDQYLRGVRYALENVTTEAVHNINSYCSSEQGRMVDTCARWDRETRRDKSAEAATAQQEGRACEEVITAFLSHDPGAARRAPTSAAGGTKSAGSPE